MQIERLDSRVKLGIDLAPASQHLKRWKDARVCLQQLKSVMDKSTDSPSEAMNTQLQNAIDAVSGLTPLSDYASYLKEGQSALIRSVVHVYYLQAYINRCQTILNLNTLQVSSVFFVIVY